MGLPRRAWSFFFGGTRVQRNYLNIEAICEASYSRAITLKFGTATAMVFPMLCAKFQSDPTSLSCSYRLLLCVSSVFSDKQSIVNNDQTPVGGT